jgi:hypothetical protein
VRKILDTTKTHLAIAFRLIAAQKSWKVRFTTAADLVIAMEAACRQGRMKEVMHPVIAAPQVELTLGRPLRFLEDGRIEMDTNSVERAMR